MDSILKSYSYITLAHNGKYNIRNGKTKTFFYLLLKPLFIYLKKTLVESVTSWLSHLLYFQLQFNHHHMNRQYFPVAGIIHKKNRNIDKYCNLHSEVNKTVLLFHN